jgi:ligand-binding sensor domain-containing protein
MVFLYNFIRFIGKNIVVTSFLRNMSILIVLIFISRTLLLAQSNPFIFRHITIEDGLAGNDVRSIIQDGKGFMWFATDNGLQKYDGHSFTNYHHNPLDSQSISSDNQFSLFQDRQKYIWSVSFILGFNRFDPTSNHSVEINNYNQQGLNDLFLAEKICMDKTGNLWLISSGSFARYNNQTGKLLSFKDVIPAGLNPSFTDGLYDSVSNQLWIADNNNGICVFDLNKNVFYSAYNNPENLPILNTVCRSGIIFMDKKRNIWLYGCGGSLGKYNISTHHIEYYNLFPSSKGLIRKNETFIFTEKTKPFITAFSEDNHGDIWMGAQDLGLIRYVSQKDSFVLIPTNLSSPNGLFLNSMIHCIFSDRDGNLWIGTDKGINLFNPDLEPFHFFENDPTHRFSQSKIESMDFLESKAGELWVATWGGGVTVFDTNLNPSSYFIHRKGDIHSLPEPGNLAWSLLRTKKDEVLIGCQHGYLAMFDPIKNTLYDVRPSGLPNKTIFNLCEDSNENVWMGLYSGFAKWNLTQNKAIHFPKFLPFHGIDSATASDLLTDHMGNVWIATLGLGLQKFDVSLNRLTEIFVPDKLNPHSITSTLINCIISINDSMLALGTGTGGINIFNMHTKEFYAISTGNDLPSNNVSALYFTPPYNLWTCAGSEFCKVNLQNRRVIRFGSYDGMKNIDFSSCRHLYQMHDGRIFTGYTGGFLYFYPGRVSSGKAPADVTLTGIRIFDDQLAIDSFLQKADTLSLDHDQNFITIQFASLNYWESNRINYIYQLEGVDKNWVSAQTQRFATYTNLAGGNYCFKVKCENSDGISSQKTTYLFIFIHPPFWQTLWFRLTISLFIGLLLYGLYRYRINQLLQLQIVRNEISKDLHDDVGSTLSSISILSQVAKNKLLEGHEEESSSIMTKINSYSQEMVEKMGDIVWAVNPGNDTIKDIIPRLNFFFIETCSSKGILLQFSTDSAVEKRILSMQGRKNIYLICKEAINNAIKYSDCRRILVEIRQVGYRFEISISDDGKGFDTMAPRQGNGLTNIQIRAAELKGVLELFSMAGHTSVIIRFPVPKIR